MGDEQEIYFWLRDRLVADGRAEAWDLIAELEWMGDRGPGSPQHRAAYRMAFRLAFDVAAREYRNHPDLPKNARPLVDTPPRWHHKADSEGSPTP